MKFGEILKTGQSKSFGMGVLTLFFMFILVVGAIVPTIRDILRIQKEINQYTEISAKLEEKIETIQRLTIELAKRRTLLQRLDVYYPFNLDYSLFVANLQYISEQTGASLVSVSYSEQVGALYSQEFAQRGIANIQPVVFTITIEGNYDQMLTFLKRLENTPYLPQVLILDYQARNRQNKQLFTITVLLFRFSRKIYNDKIFDIDSINGLQ